MRTNRRETSVICWCGLQLEPEGRGRMRAVDYGRPRDAMVPA